MVTDLFAVCLIALPIACVGFLILKTLQRNKP